MKIYELLDAPEKWTQGIYAKNQDGNYVNSESPDAICWCLLGAATKCYAMEQFWSVLHKIKDRIGTVDFATWNDEPDRTWEEVVRLCKEADV